MYIDPGVYTYFMLLKLNIVNKTDIVLSCLAKNFIRVSFNFISIKL